MRVVLLLALLLLAASVATAAPQGQSRTVAMTDICDGDCSALERYAQCGKPGEMLEGPAFDDKGNLFVVSIVGGNVYRTAPGGACARFANTGGAPQGLKFHGGKLYATDLRRGVVTIDPATGTVRDVVATYNGQNFKGPNDLIFDAVGGFYFTDPWGTSVLIPQGAIYYVSADGKVARVVDNIAFPNGIALSPDGRVLYVCEFSGQRLIAIPIKAPSMLDLGFAHAVTHIDGGNGPDGMAVDAKGDLYVAHFGAGEVDVYDPRGFFVGAIDVAAKGGWMPTNLVFHDGYLYITEASQRIVWRLGVKIAGAALR